MEELKRRKDIMKDLTAKDIDASLGHSLSRAITRAKHYIMLSEKHFKRSHVEGYLAMAYHCLRLYEDDGRASNILKEIEQKAKEIWLDLDDLKEVTPLCDEEYERWLL